MHKDIFDIVNIPTEKLNKSYVRYEPYNLCISHRHPLRRSGIFEGMGLIDKFEGAKLVILQIYPISEQQFKFIVSNDESYIALLVSAVENNVEVIESAMQIMGFERLDTLAKILTDNSNRQWIEVRYGWKF